MANGKVVDEENKSTKDGEKEEKKEEQKMVGPLEIVSKKIHSICIPSRVFLKSLCVGKNWKTCCLLFIFLNFFANFIQRRSRYDIITVLYILADFQFKLR